MSPTAYTDSEGKFHIVLPVGEHPFQKVPERHAFLDSWPCNNPEDPKSDTPLAASHIHFVFISLDSALFTALRHEISLRAIKH